MKKVHCEPKKHFKFNKQSSVLRMICLLMSFVSLLSISHLALAKHHAKHGAYQYSYVVKHHRYNVLSKHATEQYNTKGTASWYGSGFHGKLTAMGTKFNMHAMTAASKVLPLGTLVRVTNLKNQKSVVVKITDRGPFKHNRIIDLSYAAAAKLGYHKNGLTQVKVATL